MQSSKLGCQFAMEISPKLAGVPPAFALAPNNGSFPRNIRPILPNVASVRKPELIDEQQFRLRWEQHVPNQQTMFSKLLEKGSFCDVAIACEEKIINVHRLVLCSSSSYFESILSKFDRRDPVIILKDIRHDTMLSLVQFMYKGEVCLDQSRLAEVLEAAHALKIRGLSDELGESNRGTQGEPSHGHLAPLSGPTTPNGASSVPSTPSPYHSFKLAQSPSPRGGRIRRGRPKKEISAVPLGDPLTPTEDIKAEKRRRLNNASEGEKESPSHKELPVVVREEKPTISPPTDGFKRIVPPPLAPRGPCLETPALAPKQVVVVRTVPVPKPATLDDIVPLDEYIKNGGSYAQYWSEPWIALVMDAIKSKQLSLQDGANILGIKYQSLYGRYRVHHGYLITRKDEAASRRSRSDATDSGTDTNPDEWDPSMEPIVSIAEPESEASAGPRPLKVPPLVSPNGSPYKSPNRSPNKSPNKTPKELPKEPPNGQPNQPPN